MAGRAADPEGAAGLLEESIALYEREGDTQSAARVVGLLGFTLGFTGRREEAVAQMERAFEVISQEPPGEELALLAGRLGLNHWFLGDLERSAERAELALDIAERYGYPEALVIALRAKGGLAFSRGHMEESQALNKHSLGLALEHGFSQHASTSYFIISDSEFRGERYAAALGYLQDALELARKIGNRPYEWGTLAEMTYPLSMLGRWDEALATVGGSDRGANAVGRCAAQPPAGARRDPSAAWQSRRGSPDLLPLPPPGELRGRPGSCVVFRCAGGSDCRRGPPPGGACGRRDRDGGGEHARIRAAVRQAGGRRRGRVGAGARRHRQGGGADRLHGRGAS